MEDETAQTRPFKVLHQPSTEQLLGEVLAQTRTNESEILMIRGTVAEHSIVLARIEQGIAESRRGPTWWYAGTFAFLAVAVLSLVALIGRLMRWW